MKIALIQVPSRWKVKPEEQCRAIGIEYLASILRQSNYDVDTIDAYKNLLTPDDLKSILLTRDYTIIGLSVVDNSIINTIELCHMLKDFKGYICLGGYGATFWYEKLLKEVPRINFIVLGEGEITFLQLVKKIEKNHEWKNTNGIAYCENEVIYKNAKQELVEDLDTIPFPKRSEKIDVEVITASRGCYANCTFCSLHNFYNHSIGKKIRFRSPAHVVMELEEMQEKWREYIMFADDNFLGIEKKKKGWIDEFVYEIKRKKLELVFFIQCRPNDVKEDLLNKLKSVGLKYVGVGIESNCRRVLSDFKKGTNPEINSRAVKVLQKLRLFYNVFLILFDPFTTIDEISENIDFIEKIKYSSNPAHFRKPPSLLGYLTVYPGTEIFNIYNNKDLLENRGYGYYWEFKDDTTKLFYNQIVDWRKNVTCKYTETEPLKMVRHFSQKGDLGNGRFLYKTSKKYIDVEIELFRSLIKFYKNKTNGDSIEEIIESHKSRCLSLIDKLSHIHSNVINSTK